VKLRENIEVKMFKVSRIESCTYICHQK